MGVCFVVVLIKRTKLEDPDEIIVRDGLPNVGKFYYPKAFEADEEDFHEGSRNNFLCWKKLLEIMKLDISEGFIQVEIDELKQLRQKLQEIHTDKTTDDFDLEDSADGIRLIDEVLKVHKRWHAILIDLN